MRALGVAVLAAAALAAPLVVYPVFLMQALCFALFAALSAGAPARAAHRIPVHGPARRPGPQRGT